MNSDIIIPISAVNKILPHELKSFCVIYPQAPMTPNIAAADKKQPTSDAVVYASIIKLKLIPFIAAYSINSSISEVLDKLLYPNDIINTKRSGANITTQPSAVSDIFLSGSFVISVAIKSGLLPKDIAKKADTPKAINININTLARKLCELENELLIADFIKIYFFSEVQRYKR
jgi:hypothetical protein